MLSAAVSTVSYGLAPVLQSKLEELVRAGCQTDARVNPESKDDFEENILLSFRWYFCHSCWLRFSRPGRHHCLRGCEASARVHFVWDVWRAGNMLPKWTSFCRCVWTQAAVRWCNDSRAVCYRTTKVVLFKRVVIKRSFMVHFSVPIHIDDDRKHCCIASSLHIYSTSFSQFSKIWVLISSTQLL